MNGLNEYIDVKSKVLIIDDESDFCAIMKRYFMLRGYEAQSAGTIHDGLDCLSEFQPEILFLDNNLPDGNGWEIVDKIVELIPQIRVYLVSAHRNKSSFTGKATNVLVWEKPISLQLLNAIFN